MRAPIRTLNSKLQVQVCFSHREKSNKVNAIIDCTQNKTWKLILQGKYQVPTAFHASVLRNETVTEAFILVIISHVAVVYRMLTPHMYNELRLVLKKSFP